MGWQGFSACQIRKYGMAVVQCSGKLSPMTLVRMLIHRTGGRYDGQEWPGYLDTIDVPQWEADALIAEGMAQDPNVPLLDRGYDVLKAADPDYESHLKRTDGEETEEDPRYVHHVHNAPEDNSVGDDFDNDFEDSASGTDLPRPKQADNKQAWVDYVVSRGYVSEEEAKNMTKNALMELDS